MSPVLGITLYFSLTHQKHSRRGRFSPLCAEPRAWVVFKMPWMHVFSPGSPSLLLLEEQLVNHMHPCPQPQSCLLSQGTLAWHRRLHAVWELQWNGLALYFFPGPGPIFSAFGSLSFYSMLQNCSHVLDSPKVCFSSLCLYSSWLVSQRRIRKRQAYFNIFNWKFQTTFKYGQCLLKFWWISFCKDWSMFNLVWKIVFFQFVVKNNNA